MKARILFRIAGIPITHEAVPLTILLGGVVGLGVYTGVTWLRDRNYIRTTPSHAWKSR